MNRHRKYTKPPPGITLSRLLTLHPFLLLSTFTFSVLAIIFVSVAASQQSKSSSNDLIADPIPSSTGVALTGITATGASSISSSPIVIPSSTSIGASSTSIGVSSVAGSGTSSSSSSAVTLTRFRESSGAYSQFIDHSGYKWFPMLCQTWENCYQTIGLPYTTVRSSTVDTILYSTHLLGLSTWLRRNFTVVNGKYSVTAQLCDAAFDASRIVNIEVNGVIFVNAVPVPRCEGATVASGIYTLANVQVTTGQISVYVYGFRPVISGIVIDSQDNPLPAVDTPSTKTITQNSFALVTTTYTDTQSRRWYPLTRNMQAQYNTGGTVPVGTTDPALFTTFTYNAVFVWNIPVLRGNYYVNPLFCDTSNTLDRVFEVDINGQAVLTNFNPTPTSGDIGRVWNTTFGPYINIDMISINMPSNGTKTIFNGFMIFPG